MVKTVKNMHTTLVVHLTKDHNTMMKKDQYPWFKTQERHQIFQVQLF